MTIILFLLLIAVTGNHLPSSTTPPIKITHLPPIPCPSLRNYNPFVFHGSRDKANIALTFDADMTPYMNNALTSGEIKSSFDERIIEVLQKTDTPATFFVAGLWAEYYPEKLKSISRNKLFEIGNHTYSHPSFTINCYGLMPVLIKSQKISEIKNSQKAITSLTGKPVHFFRFPGGCYSENDLKILEEEGLVGIQWDVVGGDSFNSNMNFIKDGILKETQNGSIIVLHLNGPPTAPKTGEVLEEIIMKLKKKGFTFKKLSDLLDYPRTCQF